MELRFEHTIDDVVALELFNSRQSADARRELASQRRQFAILAAAAAGGVAMAASPGHHPLWLALGIPVGVILYLLQPLYISRARAAALRAWLRAGSGDANFGPQTLTVLPEGIRTKSRWGESITRWNAVERVSVDDQHLFVYQSALTALIIPKRAFESQEQMRAFLQLVDRHRQHA